ncbi:MULTISPECIES: winged helix-turn-helix domain-containing protein [unclassified Devosia]|uniref:winged helix-turn-helix domain-containing protein n=1 Tax=unclassified Devosia TaxID=196773 RepID=UPI00145C8AAF|nr:winged helix-turn-helix domain-containing protein [Devosia sp. MC521]MBJ6988914.1 winged helix-turn-helix domain-containing protein [Devosia sp. MC521]MBJ7578404.1 winged helix-turn-helix domain-containing protein [Devosia sp. MC532]QMW62263.1 winged helix-turn-helix domain-containing protein [Devosia sp. MC521]
MAGSAKPVPDHGLGHLRIVLSETAYVGPGRADLLENIELTGSIAAAGKAMGMSYKRAWSLVQDLNDGFGQPLVVSNRGGPTQGGATLTPFGSEVLAAYRRMEASAQRSIAHEVTALREAMAKPTA